LLRCFGNASGSANLSVIGGTAPYSYLWSNGAITEDIANVVASIYSITVTDANGCTTTTSVIISQPTAPLSAIISGSVNVLCFGNASGSVDLTITGGTSHYEYLWSNGAITEDISNVVAGTYSVTTTDANGCTATTSVTISQPTAPLSATISGSVNILCFGNATGSANLNITGGTSPYSYLWSNGAITEDISNVVAGTYSVTATDANGCTTNTSVTISQPTAPLSATVSGSVNVLCFGNASGSADLTVTGGTSPYSYLWSNGAITEDITNIVAGTYSVTATDANGCTTTTSVTISQPTAPLSAIISGSVNVLCFGNASGSANLTVAGGTSPYGYLWSNGAITEDITNVVAGTYSITATDANGCTTTTSVTISQPTAPLSAIISGSVNVLCFGNASGSANLTVSGGTSLYGYLWSNGAITEDIANIVAGTYSVTATDANGCTTTTSVTISQPTAPLSATVSGSVNVLCFGNASGSADLTVTGGTSPYSYLWSNGAITEDISNVVAGTYSVTATDANGCTTNTSVTISQPTAPISATVSGSVNVLCFGNATGSANLNVTGGTSPYIYLWSNGAITEDISNVVAGTYSVIATDANGCTATTSVTISQPTAPISATISGSVNVLCFGNTTGSANLTVTGGTSPYGYLWSNGAITEDISNVVAGTYSVTATDANGCTTTTSVTISQPTAPLSAAISGSINVLCFGNVTGSANLTVTGGTSPYSYLWSNNAITEDIANVVAGTYSVTATDANGCTTTTSVTISQPTASLSALISSSINGLCFGNASGSANLTITGGTFPYTYLWSNGVISEDIANITAGNYSVTVTDIKGCTTTTSVIISQPTSPLLATVSGIANVLCFGNASGAANLTITGGTSPYSFLWSNSAVTENITDVAAGNYSVTVTDANGCTTTTSVTILQPTNPLSATISSSVDALCFGDANGSANLTVTGGTSPYSYLWSNGAITEDIVNIVAGTYSVTATDANGCPATTSVTIFQPVAALLPTVTGRVNVLCYGNATGSVDITVNGGTPPYNYSWNNGSITEDISDINAGTYQVKVTDNNGCTATTLVTISQPSAPLSLILTQIATTCDRNNGIANAIVNGGTPNYEYIWSGGQISSAIHNLNNESYSVTITDTHGCSKVDSITVGRVIPPEISITSTTNETCSSHNGSITAEVNHGTYPYHFAWNSNPLLNSNVVTNVENGIYSVTIIDANGCTDTSTIAIQNHLAQIVQIDSIKPAHCNNPDGCVQIHASGGSGSYQYQWNTNPIRTGAMECSLGSGTYMITVSDGVCDVLTNVYVPDTQGPSADFSVNKISAPLSDATFLFTNLSHNFTSLIWNFGDNTTSTVYNPSHNYTTPGTYHIVLTVIDSYGCTDIANIDIVIIPEMYLWIPNAFTPNSDGLNETFGPTATGYSEKGYELRVFDRWGEQVFSSFDYDDRWDGTVKGVPVPTAYVFSWTLSICDLTGKQYKYKGSVTALGRDYHKY